MADITASATGSPVVESDPRDQHNAVTAVAITALQSIYINSSGLWALADSGAVGTATSVYLATRTAAAGTPLTGSRRCIVDGLDVAALAYNAPIYLSGTAGAWADEVGSGETEVLAGRVIPVNGASIGATANKLVRFDLPL